MKYGMIFDLDGTLWDACQAMADAWNLCVNQKLPEKHLALTYDDLHGACGMTMDAFSDLLLGEMDPREKRILSEECWEFEVEYMKEHGGVIYPGIVEAMRRLRDLGWHLYIVSNCQEGYIENFIRQSGTQDYIEDLENFGRTRKEKYENIMDLVSRNDLDLAVYLGDTDGDRVSARRAGVLFMHAAYGFGKVEEADAVAETVDEIPAQAARLLEKRTSAS